MRRRMIAIAFLMLVGATLAWADTATETDEQIFTKAEAAFRRGIESKTRLLQSRKHFADSAKAYRELHQRGIRSPALYLNLGNAALLAGHWPEAIWAYHIGLQLDPNHASLRKNLAFARTKVLIPPAGQGRLQPDAWPTWLHRPTIRELSCILVVLYLLTWLCGTLAFIARQSRFFLISIALIVITAITSFGLWYELRQGGLERRSPLVIVADNTEFYRGNGTSYPQHAGLPVLPRGLEVRQLHRRGAWLQVRLTTGEVGWVQADNVLIVGP